MAVLHGAGRISEQAPIGWKLTSAEIRAFPYPRFIWWHILANFEIGQWSVTPDFLQRLLREIQMSSLILHGR